MFNLIICMCKLRHLSGFPKAQEAGLQEQLECGTRSCWFSILVALDFVGDSISGDLLFWKKRQMGRQPHGESCVLHGFKKVLREARASEASISQADLWAEVVSAVGAVYPQRVSTVLWMEAMVRVVPVCSHLPSRHHTASSSCLLHLPSSNATVSAAAVRNVFPLGLVLLPDPSALSSLPQGGPSRTFHNPVKTSLVCSVIDTESLSI